MGHSGKFSKKKNVEECMHSDCSKKHITVADHPGEPVGHGPTLGNTIMDFYWEDKKMSNAMHHPFSVSAYTNLRNNAGHLVKDETIRGILKDNAFMKTNSGELYVRKKIWMDKQKNRSILIK